VDVPGQRRVEYPWFIPTGSFRRNFSDDKPEPVDEERDSILRFWLICLFGDWKSKPYLWPPTSSGLARPFVSPQIDDNGFTDWIPAPASVDRSPAIWPWCVLKDVLF